MLRSVGRTFEILGALADGEPAGLRLHDLSLKLRLADPTLLRFLESFEELGLVRHGDGGRYHLTGRMMRYTGGSEGDLRRIASPVMRQLSEELGEDVHLATLDADSVVCLETLKSSHLLQVAFGTGFRTPVYASAMGKALIANMDPSQCRQLLGRTALSPLTPRTIIDMAELERDLAATRERGFAMDDQELELGVNCVAVPVFDAGGRVVASLSLTAPSHRKSIGDIVALAPRIAAAAREVSERLRVTNSSRFSQTYSDFTP